MFNLDILDLLESDPSVVWKSTNPTGYERGKFRSKRRDIRREGMHSIDQTCKKTPSRHVDLVSVLKIVTKAGFLL